jgi:hypothetical protein
MSADAAIVLTAAELPTVLAQPSSPAGPLSGPKGFYTGIAEFVRRRKQCSPEKGLVLMTLSPLIAIAVVVSTATTDAVYVLFNAAVSEHRRIRAASWSSIWYLLSAFAVISYTQNAIYVLFAAVGSWIGAFCAITWLTHSSGASHSARLERAVGAGKSPHS